MSTQKGIIICRWGTMWCCVWYHDTIIHLRAKSQQKINFTNEIEFDRCCWHQGLVTFWGVLNFVIFFLLIFWLMKNWLRERLNLFNELSPLCHSSNEGSKIYHVTIPFHTHKSTENMFWYVLWSGWRWCDDESLSHCVCVPMLHPMENERRGMTCLFCSLIRRILIFSYANNHIYTSHTEHISVHTLFRVQSTHLSSESFIPFSLLLIHSAFAVFRISILLKLKFSSFFLDTISNDVRISLPPCSLRAGLVYVIKISSRFFFLKWKMATLRVKEENHNSIFECVSRDDFVNCLHELSRRGGVEYKINGKIFIAFKISLNFRKI